VEDSENSSCAVSVEKVRSGLVFQIAEKNETVKGKCEGSLRQSVKLHESSKKTGFDDGRLINNLTTIDKILESQKTFDTFYNVLFNNCQRTVTDLEQALVEKSLNLKFHVPGTHEFFVLNDDRSVVVVESLFPKWKEGKVQKFPDVPNSFTYNVALPVHDGAGSADTEYDTLVSKQRVYDAMFSLLQTDADLTGGKKAVIGNLAQCGFENALALAGNVPRPIIEQISELWSAAFELVVTVESIGVLIFAFQGKDDSKDSDEAIDDMITLASKIEKVPGRAGKSIHILNIALNTDATIHSPRKDREVGYLLNVALSAETITNPELLKEELVRCLKEIALKTASSSGGRKRYLDRFSTKLFILQNLRNEENLNKKRIFNQELEPKGFCDWTEAAKDSRRCHARKEENYARCECCVGL